MTLLDAAAPDSAPALDRTAPAPRRLWWHVLLLAAVVAVGFALVGPDESFSADEGAVIVQTELLADGTWTTPHPAPHVDPMGEWFPLEHSLRAGDGYAPYAKHPVYPLVLVPFESLAGVPGMVAVSAMGAVLAALAGALIVARFAPHLTIPTLWILGLGSPLLFNGYLVIAHTIGAALCGFGALLVLRATDDRPRPALTLGAGCALLLLSTLVRSEAVLLTGGLALGVAVGSALGLRRRALVAAAPAVAGAAGYLLDARLNRWVLGETGTDPFTITTSEGFVEGRLTGFGISWWLPTLDLDAAVPAALLVISVVVALFVGMLLRSRATDDGMLTLLAGVIVVVVSLRLVLAPATVVPGLLPAFPLLAAALPLLWPRAAGDRRLLVVASAVFAVAVLATQYSSAGSSQWGGRYFVIALPLLVPVALAQLSDAVGGRGDRARRALVGAGVVATAALAVSSVLGLREVHDRNAASRRHVQQEAIEASSGDAVVVATRAAIPRLSHDLLDDARWLLVEADDLERVLRRLELADESSVALVGPAEHLEGIGSLRTYDRAASAPDRGGEKLTVWRLERGRGQD